MHLSEIKKLSRKDFAERYPFFKMYRSIGDKEEPMFYDEGDLTVCVFDAAEIGDPMTCFYVGYFGGWSDIICLWAEHIRECLIEKNDFDKFRVFEIKEKFGRLQIDYVGSVNEKVREYTYMLEHLSEFVCNECGHIGKVNEKKMVSYLGDEYYIKYRCHNCAKKSSYNNIREYGISEKLFKKWLHANPHYGLYRKIFDQEWERNEGSWKTTIITHNQYGKYKKVLDCHKLLMEVD